MQPLKGFKVLTLAINLPGPTTAQKLVALGAEVLKIEPPSGDPLNHYYPQWYNELHSKIDVVTLDLKTENGKAELKAQLTKVDLLLTAQRPKTFVGLGIDQDQLLAINPNLCHLAITGFPTPDENLPAHDINFQAAASLIQPPHLPRTLIADLAGAERATAQALALLLSRERTGTAERVIVSLAEVAKDFSHPFAHGATGNSGPLGGALAGYGLYQAKDGWIAVGAIEEHFQTKIMKALGLTQLNHQSLSQQFAKQTTLEWENWAHQLGVPLTAVK